MSGTNYRTKQRDQIQSVIQSTSGAFTAKDLYLALDRKIGLVTIYRFLEQKNSDGALLKFSENNLTFYRYSPPCQKTDHFYLKCDHCGSIEHVDCDKITGLTAHISKKHHFTPLNDHFIINGICEDCH